MKLEWGEIAELNDRVAPFTGAWIETLLLSKYLCRKFVAPFTGAWIETSLD